jgi:4-hydroxybutyryl-CoA dehydratase/vinylacetyl-CoA-Delta-isomerase
MVPELERLTGLVALIAEYNGVEKVGHIREKLARMAYITHTVEALGHAACINSSPEPASGIQIPNLMSINAAKFTFANHFHEMCKIAHDVAGGLATTVPTYKDWNNPELRPYIEKYLGAKAGVATEDRIRVFRAIKNATHNFLQIDHVNGEGSLAAQQMFLYNSANWGKFKAAAKRMAMWTAGRMTPSTGPYPDMRTSPCRPSMNRIECRTFRARPGSYGNIMRR